MNFHDIPRPIKFAACTVMALSLLLTSCKQTQKPVSIDPAFAQYVEGFTSGVISKTSSIKVQMASSLSTTHALGEVEGKDLFTFQPKVEGKAYWLDASTIEFRPATNLRPGQLYTVTFHLDKVSKVPEQYADFTFNIQAISPSFSVKNSGLRSTGEKETMSLEGVVETADLEEPALVEKLLTAQEETKALAVKWQHSKGTKSYHFFIENIRRGAQEQSLMLSWNGEPIGSDIKGSSTIPVPAAGDFKVLQVVAINKAEQYASIQFSDPIATDQQLTGLITISDQSDLAYSIQGSEVKLYTGDLLDGDYTIHINEGILNSFGNKLSQGYVSNINFESNKPSVKIEGRGNILPHEGKLLLPFTATNLNAVDISIIKIYENNIPQFLQGNNLDGEGNLRRVATPIVQKTLRLDDDKTLDLQKRQRFTLDIDQYLKTEPGAMYRVTIGFRPEYSLFPCTAKDSALEEKNNYSNYGSEEGGPDSENNFWNRYNDYYPYGFDWQQRDNPCNSAYYNKERWASRNIIASNIGIIAKRGTGNNLTVILTDMLTAKPMSGADITVLDYQQQILGKSQSDAEGFAKLDLKRKPYLVIVSAEKEKGYLKVDDGNSLPLSRFDIEGTEIQKGIKGFIFGERGVWRPGDSLFINFIMENKSGDLPKDHPIEFELITPRGQVFQKLIQHNDQDGFHVFRTATLPESPTGNWQARIKVGGAKFEKKIRIETVMPNRLKINLDFSDSVLSSSASLTGTLSSDWLFGAPAKNLKATVDVSLYTQKNPFPQYKNYTFFNPVSDYTTQTTRIYDGTLDEEGKTDIHPKIEVDKNAPGMLRANLLVKVFEPGGAFSVRSLVMPYSPFKSYAGLQLPEGEKPWGYLTTGKKHTAQIINVNKKGKLISGTSHMKIQLYKIQWKWWWDDSGDHFSNFTQDRYNKLIETDEVTLQNGKGSWDFNIAQNSWGRYLLLVQDKESGHTTGQVLYLDEPGWQSRNYEDPTAASMLSFTSDKEQYQVGDKITLTIPSSQGGRCLVSIESGSKVLKTFWRETGQGQTIVSFKAEKEWAPNVYANVSLLQPHSQTINDLPIRMYGVLPLVIKNEQTFLKPVIQMASTIRPEEKTNITVSEQNGQEMNYSIAVVDEGLLDLTNFKTPDPHSAFYAKEALGVHSWDIYDYVIGAWGSNLGRILTIGGDQDGSGPLEPKQANRFKPVVKYFGPFSLKKGKKATHQFILPQYIGSIRVMVVAAHQGSYGNAEKTVAVKKPLMILGTAPRVLGPGEEINIPVSVFSMDKNIRNAKVTIQTNPLLQIEKEHSRVVNFSGPGEQMTYFKVRVNSKTGVGKIRLMAESGGESADYDVELNIRNANPAVIKVQGTTIQAGKEWEATAKSIGQADQSETVLEISSIPSLNLEKRLGFLIDYPHGCAEQITSRVFPQLVLDNLVEVTEAQKAQIAKNVRAGIASLQNFQTPSGGFSYWPGQREADEWATSYAGHFLLEAQARGYTVSTSMLQRWKVYQRRKANDWAPSTTQFYGADLMQAYRLYVLALAKSPELGAMNRLKAFPYLSPQAAWRLASAYYLGGQRQTALGMISGLALDFKKPGKPGPTYGSQLRDEAMVLETLTIMDRRKQAEDLVEKMAAELSSDEWYSTQTIGYSLLAISKFTGQNPSEEKMLAEISVNGKAIELNSDAYVTQIPVSTKSGPATVHIKNKGSKVLYAHLISKGQPLTGEKIDIRNDPGILKMNISYLTRNKKPLDITQLTQGTDFVAKVTITNPGGRGNYERMALTQIVPSGWEILNTRLFNGEGAFNSSSADYRDIRDDRVLTYFNLKEGSNKTFYLQLNAAYLGKYFLPGIYCSAMYDQQIQAGIDGKWVEVVSPLPIAK